MLLGDMLCLTHKISDRLGNDLRQYIRKADAFDNDLAALDEALFE